MPVNKTDLMELPADAPSRARTVNVAMPGKPLQKINAKLKKMIDLMVFEGMPWDEAAPAASLSLRAARQALDKAHVVRFLRAQRSTFRAALSARNELVAAEVRDQGENQMARLHAAKYLDGDFTGDAAAGAQGRIVVPGCVVVIKNEVNAAPGVDFAQLIEVNPEPDGSGTL